MNTVEPIHVIGGGLAGSEAAWQIAERGVPVVLHEMRPVRGTEAHQTDGLAELVCSNSFRSDDAETNAVGLLHAGDAAARLADHGARRRQPGARRRRAGGRPRRLLGGRHRGARGASADHHRARGGRRPAAGGLGQVIVATGPLTSPALAEAIRALDRRRTRSPSSTPSRRSSISSRSTWTSPGSSRATTRSGPGGTGKDYINCPMDKAQYEAFVEALLDGDKTEFKEWERHALFRWLPADRGDGRARAARRCATGR